MTKKARRKKNGTGSTLDMRSAVFRFVLRRLRGNVLLWALIFGFTVAATAIGYNSIYSDPIARAQLAASFSANSGVIALLGAPFHIESVSGFTVWRTIGIMTPVGAIWALLTAARLFRGEEEDGRWELFLAGQTTARRATFQALAAIGVSLLAFFALVAGACYAGGRNPEIGFNLSGSLLFALALTLIATLFFAIGALTSQLAPTRRRAAAVGAMIFGIFFGMRALGSAVPDLHWLLDISPLGWIQQLHPLTESQPLWLLPLFGLIAIVCAATVHLAGKRDLGDSLLADNDTARPRTGLLNGIWGAAFRLNRGAVVGWLIGLAGSGFVFGGAAKLASNALYRSDTLQRITSNFTGAKAASITTFISLGFFIDSILLLIMVTGLVGALREDEGKGYLDNFLVRPVARLSVYGQRIVFIVGAMLVVAAAATLACIGMNIQQQTGIDWVKIAQAGLTITGPAVFMLGLGIFVIGFRPHLTTALLYGLIGWSFLMEMLGSVLNLNHYLLDASILHHMALAPAAEPRWTAVGVMALLGAALAILGLLGIQRRDLEAE